MTTQTYFTRALLVPLVLPCLGTAVWATAALIPPQPNTRPAAIAALGTALAFVGLYSVPPYLLFLAWVWRWGRQPRSRAEIRWVVWLAPIIISIPFSFVLASGSLARGAFQEALGGMVVYGMTALAVGFTYVLLIEAGFLLGSALGIVGERR